MWLLKTAAGLALVYACIRLRRWRAHRKRLVAAIERLPGPPNIPYTAPLNHSVVLLYLDHLSHHLGTFTLLYNILMGLARMFPHEGLVRVWLGMKPVVILYSAECAEALLNSTRVINKADEYRFFEPWIGEGLVTSRRRKWRLRRKILTPAFHFRILNDFLPVMNEEASKLVRKLNQPKYLAVDQFDVVPLIALCTLDTICETAMGVNINCQSDEHSAYVLALKEVGELALSRVTRPWLWSNLLFYLTHSGRKFVAANKVMHEFTTKVILDRKAAWQKQLTQDDGNSEGIADFDQLLNSSFFASGNKKLAFLDLLLHQHMSTNSMSLDDVREEVDTFMFAGHDTTAMCISWTLYMLGLHQDIQARVRQELDEVVQDEMREQIDVEDSKLACELKTTNLTTEHLKELKYLDRVIKESLRMWPSIPFVARSMTEDLLMDNKYLIPKGATCMVFTQLLHNNPKYYPKPEVFDPDRFLPENSLGRHPFAYIPFSAGPRNCIGQKFAQMEVKVILAKVVANYYIRTQHHRNELEVVGELVLRTRNGLNVSLEPRYTCPPTRSQQQQL